MTDLLDITGHLDGYALRLDGEVLTFGTLTHCARARAEYRQALAEAGERLALIVRTERARRSPLSHNLMHKDADR